ncbi:MAG TPA: 30S ribosomal protein S4 [Candidatus Peribacteraceae bacterium]|nr:30S ribosomal protein S4 [Candidatus Peribacteraceae bacterium]
MKYNGPKARRVRRLGINLYGSDKYDKILQKKPYGPGKGPKTRAGRDSEYAKQLKEKQKARGIYGISEKQFLRLFSEANKSKGRTGDQMKQLLEQRLDNLIYRAGFAMTRLQSRQFAGHGLFLVDGHRVTSPSYRVMPGQVVSVRPKAKDSPVFAAIRERHEKYTAPKWLKVDASALQAEVVSVPEAADAEQAIDMRLVVEFYSRT